jgi:type I restriction enzyme S subunit
MQMTAKSSVDSVRMDMIANMFIPIPPTLAEQTAIATALSDADGLITGLEKLIAKKRNIKQGAMQQLLQPKEGWEVKKLGEVFTITAGGDLDVKNFSLITDEKYCYPIYSNALMNKGLYGFTSEYRQIENTITVTARGQVGVANPRDHKYTAIGRVIMLNPIIELNINFITECINNFIKFNNESTGVPQLTAPQISKYEIIIPDYKEQTQIAKILSDMDAEISALEQKLDKYKKIKLGMMQELLTGKTRLN